MLAVGMQPTKAQAVDLLKTARDLSISLHYLERHQATPAESVPAFVRYKTIDAYYAEIERLTATIGGALALDRAYRLNRSLYLRRNRLLNRLIFFFLLGLARGRIKLITLTFSDKALATTTAKERRRAVGRFLRSFSVYYVANIDFNTENKDAGEREHYHAIAVLKAGIVNNYIDVSPWVARFGIAGAKNIGRTRKDARDLADYLIKIAESDLNRLVNHAFKASTKRRAVIYSRNIKGDFDRFFNAGVIADALKM